MSFRDFTYPQVINDLGLTERSADLFAGVPPVPPGPIADTVRLAGASLAVLVNTEKARSEWAVAPVLADLWVRFDRQINLHSGVTLAPDPEAGLTGVCDFLIGRTPQLPHVAAPVVVIFEAKNDSIMGGFGQCIAAMVAVQRFNRQAGRDIDPVYGCSTTGSLWQFLRLSGSEVTVDQTEYGIRELDKLLGILSFMVGPPPNLAAPRPAA